MQPERLRGPEGGLEGCTCLCWEAGAALREQCASRWGIACLFPPLPLTRTVPGIGSRTESGICHMRAGSVSFLQSAWPSCFSFWPQWATPSTVDVHALHAERLSSCMPTCSSSPTVLHPVACLPPHTVPSCPSPPSALPFPATLQSLSPLVLCCVLQAALNMKGKGICPIPNIMNIMILLVSSVKELEHQTNFLYCTLSPSPPFLLPLGSCCVWCSVPPSPRSILSLLVHK
jgi:hypothetical protein